MLKTLPVALVLFATIMVVVQIADLLTGSIGMNVFVTLFVYLFCKDLASYLVGVSIALGEED